MGIGTKHPFSLVPNIHCSLHPSPKKGAPSFSVPESITKTLAETIWVVSQDPGAVVSDTKAAGI